MNIYKFYFEIKSRFSLLLLTWNSVILVCYVFKEIFLFKIIKPNISSLTNNNFFYFILTDVTEMFSVYMTIIFFIGKQVFTYYVFYHFLLFLVKGLYKCEYSKLLLVFKTSILFFIFSIIFFEKFLFPFSWEFFASFQNFALKFFVLHFEAKLSEYLNFYVKFYYLCVFYFQIFMILVLFLDHLKYDLLFIKSFRKTFYYFFIVFSTITTPPDVFSQVFLSLSIIFSFEFSMLYIITKNYIR